MEENEVITPEEMKSETSDANTEEAPVSVESTTVEVAPKSGMKMLGLLNKQRGTNHEELNDEALKDLEDEFELSVGAINALKDAIEKFPELESFFSEIANGSSPRKAFHKSFDMESMQPMEGDEDLEDINSVIAERKKAKEEHISYLEDVENNKAETINNLIKFKKDKGWDDKQMDEFIDYTDGILTDATRGKITYEMLDLLDKGRSYETDIENTASTAKEEGMIEGKNAIIEKAMKPKSKSMGEETLPDLASTSRTAPSTPKAPVSPFNKMSENWKNNNRY